MDGRRADPVLFDDLYGKATRISFDEPSTSSDGGVVLLSGADRRLGLTDVFVRLIEDPRQPGKIEHTVEQIIRQRIFGIACGYIQDREVTNPPFRDVVHRVNPPEAP